MVHGLLARAAVVVQLGHGVLQLGMAGFSGSAASWAAANSPAAGPALFVGRGQSVTVAAQAFLAHVQLAALLVDAALLGGQHADLLLHLHHGAALVGGGLLGAAQRVFQVGQLHGLLLDLGGQHLGALLGVDAAGGQVLHLGFGVLLAGRPLGDLLGQLGEAGFDALAAFDHVADLGFELADLGRGFVKAALRLVDQVARRVVRLADGFQVGFHGAQVGHARFEVVDGLQAFGAHAVLLGLGVGALQEPELVLLQGDVGLQRVVLGGHLGLLFQAFQVGVEFAQDVFDAREVLGRAGQAVLGLAPAFLVLGHARGFLQEEPQLFGRDSMMRLMVPWPMMA